MIVTGGNGENTVYIKKYVSLFVFYTHCDTPQCYLVLRAVILSCYLYSLHLHAKAAFYA